MKNRGARADRVSVALVASVVPVMLVALATLATLATATGCGAEPRVVRVYDGRLVEGRYVSPDAYAAFLRGVLAEESGDLAGAATAYGIAAGEDDADPEILARLGEVKCKLDPRDASADRVFGRALKVDPTYAGALAAWSRCAASRGRNGEAIDLARRAAAADPKDVEIASLVVRAEAAQSDPGVRERAVALTLAHGESPAAWDALAAWGRSHRDAELVARALEGLVRAAPTRSVEVERGAVALLGGGQLALARRVASTLADAPREMGVIGPRDATVARLAVDEALLRGDSVVACARAMRGHVALAEVAARAFVLDKREIAAAIATWVMDADPGASGAGMVKAALQGAKAGAGAGVGAGAGAGAGVAKTGGHLTDQPPELCALVFADRLATEAGADVARLWLARITRTPMAAHDPLAGPLAVDLAARGVLPAADLPAELRVSGDRARAP